MGEVQVGDRLLGADGRPSPGSSPPPRSCTDGPATRWSSPTARSSSPRPAPVAHHHPRQPPSAGRRIAPPGTGAESSRQKLRDVMSAALREPDRSVTGAEVLAAAGLGVQHGHAQGRAVGGPGRGAGRGPGRGPVPFLRLASPAYASRHALLTAMVEQADRPKNAATTAVHRDVVTTAELAASLRTGPDQRLNHAVAVARAAVLPETRTFLSRRTRWVPGWATGPAGPPRSPPPTRRSPSRSRPMGFAWSIADRAAPLRHPAAAAAGAAPRRCVVCGQRFTPRPPRCAPAGGSAAAGPARSAARRSRRLRSGRSARTAAVRAPPMDCARPAGPTMGRPRPSCAAWGAREQAHPGRVPAGVGGPAPRPAGRAARHRRVCTCPAAPCSSRSPIAARARGRASSS